MNEELKKIFDTFTDRIIGRNTMVQKSREMGLNINFNTNETTKFPSALNREVFDREVLEAVKRKERNYGQELNLDESPKIFIDRLEIFTGVEAKMENILTKYEVLSSILDDVNIDVYRIYGHNLEGVIRLDDKPLLQLLMDREALLTKVDIGGASKKMLFNALDSLGDNPDLSLIHKHGDSLQTSLRILQDSEFKIKLNKIKESLDRKKRCINPNKEYEKYNNINNDVIKYFSFLLLILSTQI